MPVRVCVCVCVCVRPCGGLASSLTGVSWALSPFCTSANRCACISGIFCFASSEAVLLGQGQGQVHSCLPAAFMLGSLEV